MVKVFLYSLGSTSSNLGHSTFFTGPIIQEKLIKSMEESLLEIWEFLNVDLNLTLCVLNSQNGKKWQLNVCELVSEWEREIASHNPIFPLPLWIRMDQNISVLNESVYYVCPGGSVVRKCWCESFNHEIESWSCDTFSFNDLT